MQPGIEGKVAIVTGGSKGLGAAIAEKLLEHGVRVTICARREEALEATVARLKKVGEVLSIRADVTNRQDVQELFRRTVSHFGRLDVLVNNAGGAHPGSFDQLTDEDWQRDFDVKLMAMIRCCREALGIMRPQGSGRIVNINATMGKIADPRFFASTTLRAACIAFTKTLAVEMAPYGILVNSVNIGFVETQQWRNIHQRRAPDKAYAEFISEWGRKEIPLGRLGKPDEVAAVVTFLVSEQASYLTGASVDVAGGQGTYI